MARPIRNLGGKPMAIDLVELGEELSQEELLKTRKSNAIPEGITSRMLYDDVVRIAWPSFVEMGLTQLAAMINMMMVGGLGAWAVAAVGLTIQPRFLLMTLFMALNVGATAMVARNKGAGNQERANLILRQALMINVGLTVIMSVLGYIFAQPMVQFMGARDDLVLAGSTTYLQIQMIGFTLFAITATITAALRGAGETRIPMIYNLIGNAIGVGSGIVLIYGYLGFPRLELAGASIALILGQAVAFILAAIAILSGKFYIRFSFRDKFTFDREAISQITKIGFPSMLEQLVMRTGMVIYSITVAGLGTLYFATHQILFNIQAMSFMTGQAFAVSATSLVGQSLGRRRPDMAHLYAARTRRIGMIFAVFLGVLFFFFGRQIIGLYTYDPFIIELGGAIMMMMAFMLPLQSSQFILAGALRGAGDTRATAIITFVSVLLIRPFLAIGLIELFSLGLWGAWIALAADQAARSGLVWLRFISGKWKAVIKD